MRTSLRPQTQEEAQASTPASPPSAPLQAPLGAAEPRGLCLLRGLLLRGCGMQSSPLTPTLELSELQATPAAQGLGGPEERAGEVEAGQRITSSASCSCFLKGGSPGQGPGQDPMQVLLSKKPKEEEEQVTRATSQEAALTDGPWSQLPSSGPLRTPPPLSRRDEPFPPGSGLGLTASLWGPEHVSKPRGPHL